MSIRHLNQNPDQSVIFYFFFFSLTGCCFKTFLTTQWALVAYLGVTYLPVKTKQANLIHLQATGNSFINSA